MRRERFRNEVGELGGFGSLGYGKEDMGREGRIVKCWRNILQYCCWGESVIVSSSIDNEQTEFASASSSLPSSQYIFVFKFKVSIL